MVAFCLFYWRSTEDLSTLKFLTIGLRQRYNLKMSVRELLYSAIFCSLSSKVTSQVTQYYSSQSEVVLKLCI